MFRTTAQSDFFRGNRLFTLLAFAFAIIAGVLVFVAVQSAQDDDSGSGASIGGAVPVVVAARDIDARTKITADMIRIEQVPTAAVISGAFENESPVIGQVARFPIAEREQLSAQKLGVGAFFDADENEGLAFIIPEGYRGLALTVDESTAVGGHIIAGDHVDIIVLLDEDIAGIEKAVTALQDIEVLAVAQETQEAVPPPIAGDDQSSEDAFAAARARDLGIRPEDAEANPGARTLTLAVTPAQAQLLALAQQHGEIILTLRPFESQEALPLDPADLLPIGALPESERD